MSGQLLCDSGTLFLHSRTHLNLYRLRAKLKTICEKFELRELHYKSLLRSKDAEIQCLTAKYEEQRRAAESEATRCRALSSQVSTFSHTEAELRSQLNIYVEKFKQVPYKPHPDWAIYSRCSW